MKKLAAAIAIVVGLSFIGSIVSYTSALSYAQEDEPKRERPDHD